MKRVFSNGDQVLHLWANQSQTDARCKNVFFNGKSCYSYGYHYELGRMITFRGVQIAMINDSGYSNTTSKHISSAWHAVSHLPRLKSNNLGPEYVRQALVDKQDVLISDIFDQFNRIKFWQDCKFEKSDWLFEEIEEFNKLCTLLKFDELKLEFDMSEMLGLLNDHVKYRQYKQSLNETPEALAKKEQARLRKLDLSREKLEAKIELWLRSIEGNYNELRELEPQLIRVRGDKVETTRGAEISLEVAKKILRRVLNKQIKTGEAVGPFTFGSITDDIVRIGCHRLSLKQAKEVLMATNSRANLTLVG